MQRVLPSLFQSSVCRGMDVFDIDVTAKMQIMHVRPHWASSGKGQHQRDEKTQRDVAQSMRHNSILKLITVCKRFNIDVLHPQSMHMVLSLLCKTEDRLGQFERIHAQDALTNPVILDMPAVDSIEQIQHDLLYSLADWVNLFSYMHCVVPEEDARHIEEDPMVARFRTSLSVGGLHDVLRAGTPSVLMCMIHTFPANTPISQMLERFVVRNFPKCRDVEVSCLRTATHFMDVVIPDSVQQVSIARVISSMHNLPVFASDVRYVLQREESIRAMCQLSEGPEHVGRPSLRRLVQEILHEKVCTSTLSFDNWRSQLQFGVATSMHLQLLLYFISAQQQPTDMDLYRNLYTDKIIERTSRSGVIDNIDHTAIAKIIRSVRIYKHSINNLIDFRTQCLHGFNVKTRMALSLAQVVQLYICCFQHASVFEHVWKQVVPIMNHTIATSCEKFRAEQTYDSNAVVRTLIDSNTVVNTELVLDTDHDA